MKKTLGHLAQRKRGEVKKKSGRHFIRTPTHVPAFKRCQALRPAGPGRATMPQQQRIFEYLGEASTYTISSLLFS